MNVPDETGRGKSENCAATGDCGAIEIAQQAYGRKNSLKFCPIFADQRLSTTRSNPLSAKALRSQFTPSAQLYMAQV
jgi:hypothetical protein